MKVAAKDKVEVVKRENGEKVKVTTIYTVDVKTGNITQTEREEEISSEVITSKSEEKVPTVEELKPFEGGVNPSESVVTEELKPFEGGVNPSESVVTEELKPFEGGVNPSESVVTEELKPFEGGVNPSESVVTEELKPFEGGVNPSESVMTEEVKPFEGGVNSEVASVKEELPELKVAFLRDEEGNVLDVLAISEEPKEPKELKGYKYTGKEEVDSEGNKIYIYKKAGLNAIQTVEQDAIVVNQSQVLKENIESKTKITTDKNDKKTVDKILPNTGKTPIEHGVLGGMLLAATMMLAKRKVKK